MATLEMKEMQSIQKLEQAFCMLDIVNKIFNQNQDGYLEKYQLEEIMGGPKIDELSWNLILNECDLNQDGKISKEEFIHLMKADLMKKRK